MSQAPSRFHGVFPYLVSPVDPASGRVRADVLAELVRRLLDAGVHGLSPLGSTGEVPYLSPEQRADVVATTVVAAGGRVPVLPGVAAFTPADAIAQVRRYRELGADGAVLILQQYFPLSEPALEGFYRQVAGAVDCPLAIYANPRLLGVRPSTGLLARLAAEVPNIRYYKDASGDTGRLLSVIARTEGRLGVFSASAHIPLLVLRLGGVGWMAGPACLMPAASVQIYELAQAGRWDEAMAVQRRIWPVNEVFQRHGLAACVKVGLRLQGLDVGDPMPPQLPLGPEAVQDVREALAAAGVL